MFMSFEKSCKYFQDSKCTLKGGCCDLNCDIAHSSDRDNLFCDEIDTFTQWWLEKEQREENLRLKII